MDHKRVTGWAVLQKAKWLTPRKDAQSQYKGRRDESATLAKDGAASATGTPRLQDFGIPKVDCYSFETGLIIGAVGTKEPYLFPTLGLHYTQNACVVLGLSGP